MNCKVQYENLKNQFLNRFMHIYHMPKANFFLIKLFKGTYPNILR